MKIYLSQLFRCVALFHCSIHQAIRDNAPIVDVDGSYLYKKSKRIEDSGRIVALLDSPSAPITGWEIVTEVNANIIAKKIPVSLMALSTHIFLLMPVRAVVMERSGRSHEDTLTGHQDALTVWK